MSYRLISYRIGVDRGCLVLAGEGFGEVPEWDPGRAPWYRSGNAFVFAVSPSADGEVEVEVWEGRPQSVLPEELFSRQEVTGEETLAVLDPGDRANVRFRASRGSAYLSVFVNRTDRPDRVQVVLERK